MSRAARAIRRSLKFGIAVDSSSVPVGGAVEEVRRSDLWATAERVLASFSRLEIAQAARNGHCDAKEARRGLPLAALRVSDRLFRVLQEHGYEDETYVIAEVGPSDVRYRIEVNGRGC